METSSPRQQWRRSRWPAQSEWTRATAVNRASGCSILRLVIHLITKPRASIATSIKIPYSFHAIPENLMEYIFFFLYSDTSYPNWAYLIFKTDFFFSKIDFDLKSFCDPFKPSSLMQPLHGDLREGTTISPASHRKQETSIMWKDQSCIFFAQLLTPPRAIYLFSLSALTLAFSRLPRSFLRPCFGHRVPRAAFHPGPAPTSQAPLPRASPHPTLFSRSWSLMSTQCDWVINSSSWIQS